MGSACSSTACNDVDPDDWSRTESPDRVMHDVMVKSIQATTTTTTRPSGATSGASNGLCSSTTAICMNATRRKQTGQQHLLFRHSSNHSILDRVLLEDQAGITSTKGGITKTTFFRDVASINSWLPEDTALRPCRTRLLIRRRSPLPKGVSVAEQDGHTGTHIYAIRYPEDSPDEVFSEQALPRPESDRQEQYPGTKSAEAIRADAPKATVSGDSGKVSVVHRQQTLLGTNLSDGLDIYSRLAMASKPRQTVTDWVTVSDEHEIYIADVGLTSKQCDHIVNVCEQVCRGQYAAYTYAKQTLGCREYPLLGTTCFHPVHTITSDIIKRLGSPLSEDQSLQLDDREPHIVKYDVTKKERQRLDMHTDKSEWTFLIALSNGCGVDYEGGGTFFECLDATVHIQRGHALVFPGKLRHCGQKITHGLRFLLVGFLVDKSTVNQVEATSSPPTTTTSDSSTPATAGIAGNEVDTNGASLSAEA